MEQTRHLQAVAVGLLGTWFLIPLLLVAGGLFLNNYDPNSSLFLNGVVVVAVVQVMVVQFLISKTLSPYTTFRQHVKTLTLYLPFTTGIFYLILYLFLYQQRLMVYVYFIMILPTIVMLEPQHDNNERILRWGLLVLHLSGYLPFFRHYGNLDPDFLFVKNWILTGPMVWCAVWLLQLAKKMEIFEVSSDAELLWTSAEHTH